MAKELEEELSGDEEIQRKIVLKRQFMGRLWQ
jgi:hypothetical protein